MSESGVVSGEIVESQTATQTSENADELKCCEEKYFQNSTWAVAQPQEAQSTSPTPWKFIKSKEKCIQFGTS